MNELVHDPQAMTQFYSVTQDKPKLLVVDDQPLHIQVMHQLFGGSCQVFMATSGRRALELCSQNLPDLVLLDIVMPEMDGFEVCARLKADPATQHIPVIFLTAEHDPLQETQGLELGAVDFITKPINPAIVQARVKTQLNLKRQSDILRNLVYLDGLTGVYNRRYFDQQMGLELARAQRGHTQLSVIMLDIDFFKRYNDQYGHLAGDDCLRMLASSLKSELKRSTDLVARYGGEEFACILPETDLDGALQIAEALEQGVRALQIPHAGSDMASCVTISLGVACRLADTSATVSELLAHADAQLYKAKNTGRGRVCGAAF